MHTSIKKSWDITNKPSTQTKLTLLRDIFQMWLTVWNKQDWIAKELYVIDLFAGKGMYSCAGREVYGSPLIFLDVLAKMKERLRHDLKFKLFFVEKNTRCFEELDANITKFFDKYTHLSNSVKIIRRRDDCNEIIDIILKQIKNKSEHPLFVLIDPWGIKIEKTTVAKIVKLRNRKDIMFNFILEGVRRTKGIAEKHQLGEKLNEKEIGSLKTLEKFIGDDIDIIDTTDREILEGYVTSVFTGKEMKVVAYDMKYPDRDDILYYLLFASKQPAIAEVVRNIYARTKEKKLGLSLFGRESFIGDIYDSTKRLRTLERKSLLYKTRVEYGNWTINHIEGCMHGCRFPCYAFMMSRKFGRVTTPYEWRKPKIVSNALDLLEDELRKYGHKIDFVQLSFMTDPFMYDANTKTLVPEIEELTLKIISRLNAENIRTTTLTKGYYPDEILNRGFLPENEYGITLVSLNDEFKKNFEPFSAPYQMRVDSLKKLSKAGLKTWVSIEPYPTPNLDETASNIELILKEIKFVDKIIFGKLNYNVQSSKFKNNRIFYRDVAKRVIKFCRKHDITYHIKSGTPYSRMKTKHIFRTT